MKIYRTTIEENTHSNIIDTIKMIIPRKQVYSVSGSFAAHTDLLYDPKRGDGENDWNKLIGFSFGYGFKKHHENSIRLAWRPYQDNHHIQYGIYYYINGIRNIYNLGKFNVNDISSPYWDDFILVYNKKEGVVRLNIRGIVSKVYYKKDNDNTNYCYFLYPYIGGQGKAVRDTRIIIRNLTWK